jgi:glutathione-specific gamma-glutamylcyclotransferase
MKDGRQSIHRCGPTNKDCGAAPTVLAPLLALIVLSVLPIGAPGFHAHAHRRPKVASVPGKMSTRTNDVDEPVWDPVQQIYVGGRVPGASDEEVQKMVQEHGLRVLGYGSLTWKPSGWLQGGVPGRAYGYRRVWAQKSTDHRGTPAFPGIVCTLLTQPEYQMATGSKIDRHDCFVDGLVYHVPDHHVEECLQDLDHREKGGYAREIVEVVDRQTGERHPVLLYRGTPDNPAFWPRALNDLRLAASVIAVAVGPSGPNVDYLQPLAEFLRNKDCVDDDTLKLWDIVRSLNPERLHFFIGCGSNQYGQLLSDSRSFGEVDTLTELVYESERPIAELMAGGGHSAVLDDTGRLQLFGWNDFGQAPAEALTGIQSAALGFSHTVVIDMETRQLTAFGDDRYKQVSCIAESPHAKSHRFVSVAAGLFHSAAITESGSVVVFQKERVLEFAPQLSKAVKVACGKQFTVVLDDNGRLWSMGSSNKHGELGRDGLCSVFEQVKDVPRNVTDVDCGWSHALALSIDGSVFGWGRYDKGQFDNHSRPGQTIERIACGSEFSILVDSDDNVWSTGWNEHGNLGHRNKEDCIIPIRPKELAVGGAHVLVYSTSPFCACTDVPYP